MLVLDWPFYCAIFAMSLLVPSVMMINDKGDDHASLIIDNEKAKQSLLRTGTKSPEALRPPRPGSPSPLQPQAATVPDQATIAPPSESMGNSKPHEAALTSHASTRRRLRRFFTPRRTGSAALEA